MQLINNQLYWDDGSRLFIVGAGGPEGLLYSPDPAAQINKQITHGDNSIYIIACRSHGGDGTADENPFINNDPAQGIDTAVLDSWVPLIDTCQANKIAVYFLLYDDSTNLWGDKGIGALSADEQAFIQTMVNTFTQECVIWGYAEEADSTFSQPRITSGVTYIKSLTNQLVAIHQNPSLVPGDYGQDIFAVQAGVFAPGIPNPDVVNSNAITAKTNTPNANVGFWEIQPSHGDDSEESTRQTTWAAIMGGASVMVLMRTTTTNVVELQQSRIAQQFIENINIDFMVGDNARAANDTNYVLADQNNFIAYGRVVTNMGVTGLQAGNYTLTWVDVISGVTETQNIATINGLNVFTRPIALGAEVALSGVYQAVVSTSLTNSELLLDEGSRPKLLTDDYHVCLRQMRATQLYLQAQLPFLDTLGQRDAILQHIDVVMDRPNAHSSIVNRSVGQEDTAKIEHNDGSYSLTAQVNSMVGQMTALKNILPAGSVVAVEMQINKVLGLYT